MVDLILHPWCFSGPDGQVQVLAVALGARRQNACCKHHPDVPERCSSVKRTRLSSLRDLSIRTLPPARARSKSTVQSSALLPSSANPFPFQARITRWRLSAVVPIAGGWSAPLARCSEPIIGASKHKFVRPTSPPLWEDSLC